MGGIPMGLRRVSPVISLSKSAVLFRIQRSSYAKNACATNGESGGTVMVSALSPTM